MTNTSGNVFNNEEDGLMYVLVTGRWFRAESFAGPWSYIDAATLPTGTAQAQDALIANQIPQTAHIDRYKAKFTPQINGPIDLRAVPGTPLSYVFNSPVPIIRFAADQWYAEQSGVWFTASSTFAQWTVATSVPAEIYAIPASSPIYYSTFVKIYEVQPDYVVVGYTPGYTGTIVASNGVVVFGTGYRYSSYIGSTVWYGAPVTYGYAANPTWTPWTGWAIGFGFGWAVIAASSNYYCYVPAPYWGAMLYAPYAGYAYGAAGAVAWGPSGWAATTGNVYQKWGATTAVTRTSAGYNAWTGNAWTNKVGTSYNSTTGRISAGQRASVGNVYTGGYVNGARGASYNPSTGAGVKGGAVGGGNAYTGAHGSAGYIKATGPDGNSAGVAKVGNNVYAGKDGNVYKSNGDGSWQKYDNGGWNGSSKAAADRGQSPAGLDAQQQARQAGDQRSAGSSWGSNSWGGGFKGGGAAGGRNWGGGQFGGRSGGRAAGRGSR